ncbi:MAG: DUF6034 family protein [Firmicutes bacterium]|nr:DUF6034 family protein [Bacillota bacterium]
MKAKAVLCLFLTALLGLSACQATPEKVVVSKNNGEFEANVTVSAGGTHEPDAMQDIIYNETFSSTDGSVEFQFAIEETVTAANMPVLLVEPHFLTSEDAERIAYTIFDENSVFCNTAGDYPWTAAELEEVIGIWEALLDADYYTFVMGETSKSEMESDWELLEKKIAEYSALLSTASQTCSEFAGFEIRDEFYFLYPSSWTADMSEAEINALIEELDDAFEARVISHQVSYKYSVSTRHKSDYNYNLVYVYPWYPAYCGNFDTEYYQSLLCSRDEPATQEQVEAVREQALELLNAPGLGEWYIASCEAEQLYCGHMVVSVTALPVLEGLHAVRQPQVSLRDNAASNYRYTTAELMYAPDGTILKAVITSPIDIVEVLNDNVATYSFDELMEHAKTYFSLSDAYNYGMETTLDYYGAENIGCTVEVNRAEYGLARVRVDENSDNYYYVPALILYGDVTYYFTEDGETVESYENRQLVAINAVDNTIINSVNS